jgi:hypothetical protein
MFNQKDAVEVYPKVFLVENFLTPEEIACFDKRCREATEEDWSTQIQKDYERMAKELYPDDEVAQKAYLDKGWDDVWTDKHLSLEPCDTFSAEERIYEYFPKEQYDIVSPARAQRQYPGCGGLRVHYDAEYEKGMVMSIVIYINDDYNGGNLKFVDYDFSIKPKAGAMLIFPPTEDYLHGVEEVLDGPSRYAIPAFVYTRGTRFLPKEL